MDDVVIIWVEAYLSTSRRERVPLQAHVRTRTQNRPRHNTTKGTNSRRNGKMSMADQREKVDGDGQTRDGGNDAG